MKNRTAIYCYYSKKGKVYKETCRQLNDLRNNVNYLIVVVNGEIDNVECLAFADRVIIRDNMGLDAGAYKHVLMMNDIKNIIKDSNELILCNSTFFGPFCGFKKIFDAMESKEVDFWGINLFNNGLMKYIQSYFLVYRQNILKDESFYDFFKDNIDERKNEWSNTCYWFETRLFQYLESRYKYDCYLDRVEYNIYQYPDKCIALGFPILKKKSFSMLDMNERMVSSLSLIKKKFCYPIEDILDEVLDEYKIEITSNDVDNYECKEEYSSDKYPISKITEEQIKSFCCESSNLYIYGVGNYAYLVFNEISSCHNIKGFIVSDAGHRKSSEFMGKPVFLLSEIKDKRNADIIIALNKENTDLVKENLFGFKNVFNLWL